MGKEKPTIADLRRANRNLEDIIKPTKQVVSPPKEPKSSSGSSGLNGLLWIVWIILVFYLLLVNPLSVFLLFVAQPILENSFGKLKDLRSY